VAGVVVVNGKVTQLQHSFSLDDVPLGHCVAISRLILQLHVLVFGVDEVDQRLLEHVIHHPGVEVTGGNLQEPLLLLIIKSDDFPAVRGAAGAVEGEIVIEESGEVDCDLFPFANPGDGLH
jgi:hypothetical protein